MSGSGARDGYGSPPWDPADPVPELDDTQAIPGLGTVPGPSEPPRRGGESFRPGDPGPSGYYGQRGGAFDNGGYGAQGSPAGSSWSGNGAQGSPAGSSWSGNGAQGSPAGSSWSGNGGWQQSQAGGASWTGRDGAGPGRDQGGYGDSRSGRPDAPRSGQARGAGQTRGAFDATRDDLGALGPDSGRRDDADDGDGGQGQGQGQKGDAAGGGHAKHSKRQRSFWRELPVLVVVALVLALVIKSFVIQAFYIPSASMENTLEIGDRVLINKVVYHLRPIHRGDIIVFDGTGSWDFDDTPASSNIFSKAWSELEGIVGISHDSSIYIKRVIGLPGDHVVCCNSKGQVTVNGVALSESSYLYPGNAPSTQTFNITVPPGRLWVMGDHRAVSYDSRGHMGDPGGGTIPESAVLGRAFVIIWPPSRWGFLNIPATFEQPALNASNANAGGSAAALAAAMDNGSPIQESGSAIPLGLGLAGAIPLTLLQRTARRRLKSRRDKRRGT